jgi:hypothetical protein
MTVRLVPLRARQLNQVIESVEAEQLAHVDQARAAAFPHKRSAEVPQHQSKPIPAASAADGSGSLQTALSKATRRTPTVTPDIIPSVTSDTDL